MKTIQLLKSPKLKPLGLLTYLQLSACLKVDRFSMAFLTGIWFLAWEWVKKIQTIPQLLQSCAAFLFFIYMLVYAGLWFMTEAPGFAVKQIIDNKERKVCKIILQATRRDLESDFFPLLPLPWLLKEWACVNFFFLPLSTFSISVVCKEDITFALESRVNLLNTEMRDRWKWNAILMLWFRS